MEAFIYGFLWAFFAWISVFIFQRIYKEYNWTISKLIHTSRSALSIIMWYTTFLFIPFSIIIYLSYIAQDIDKNFILLACASSSTLTFIFTLWIIIKILEEEKEKQGSNKEKDKIK